MKSPRLAGLLYCTVCLDAQSWSLEGSHRGPECWHPAQLGVQRQLLQVAHSAPTSDPALATAHLSAMTFKQASILYILLNVHAYGTGPFSLMTTQYSMPSLNVLWKCIVLINHRLPSALTSPFPFSETAVQDLRFHCTQAVVFTDPVPIVAFGRSTAQY